MLQGTFDRCPALRCKPCKSLQYPIHFHRPIEQSPDEMADFFGEDCGGPFFRQETALRQSSGALSKNRPRPRKTFQQTMLRGSIVMLSVGNPSAAGTQRRQALQEFPVILAGTTARGITRKRWRVAARLDTLMKRHLVSYF